MKAANPKTIAAIFIAGFLVLLFGKPLRAQELPKQTTNVSDAQLRAFAKAYVQVDKIRQEYEPRLKEAKDPKEGNQIQTEAMGKVHEAVAKEGLTEDSYRQIVQLANSDKEVRAKVLAMINEEKQKS